MKQNQFNSKIKDQKRSKNTKERRSELKRVIEEENRREALKKLPQEAQGFLVLVLVLETVKRHGSESERTLVSCSDFSSLAYVGFIHCF